MEYEKGDHVRLRSGKSEGFIITETQVFDGVLCYTGAGRLWWSADELEFDLTPEQEAAAEALEFEMHGFMVAMHRIAIAEQEAAKLLPGRHIKRIRDAVQA